MLFRSLARAARYVDGWNPSQISVDEYRRGVPRLRELYKEAGRTGPQYLGINQILTIAATDDAAHEQAYPTVAQVFSSEEAYRERTLVGSPTTVAARLTEFHEAGVNWIEVRPVYPTIENLIEQMRILRDEVLPAVIG